MSSLALPECPAPLRGIQHFLKAATEHEQRNPVVTYWCRLHALQTGLKMSTKTSEETGFLLKLMDWLETTKKTQSDNEAITNDVAAQAHLENYALQLFMYADSNDRASNFGKNVIKAFYTAGVIYDVSTTFGELNEEAAQNRKYAKWKAAYIHNCLKNGETPVPGPMDDGENDSADNTNADAGPAGNVPSTSGLADADEDQVSPTDRDSVSADDPETQPDAKSAEGDTENDEAGFTQPTPPPSSDAFGFPSVPKASSANFPSPPINPSQGNFPYPNLPKPDNPNPYNPPSTPTNVTPSQPSFDRSNYNTIPATEGGVTLEVEQMTKAQKYVKWAGSALNYDDVPTAVLNLQKALHLLTTGQDPA